MRILIADDESPKLMNLHAFVSKSFPEMTIEHARSVKSTISALRNQIYNLVLLDMSLPTFDIGPGEPGGRPQGFGGTEVLRHMDFYQIMVPEIVVTQYEAFSNNEKHIDLSALDAQLRQDHAINFKGCIYYGALNDAWEKKLKELICIIFDQG